MTVESNMFCVASQMSAKASKQTLENREHLVVPCVMLQEGVLNEYFYPQEVISAFANSWNGVAVPVGHPKTAEGEFTSANTPEIIEQHRIGTLYNSRMEEGKLKADIWIDVEKAKTLGYSYIVEHFNSGEMMEVSTGLVCQYQPKEGEYKGTKYKGVLNQIHPDHLALLPDEKGAMTIDDGIGAMRINSKSALNQLTEGFREFLTNFMKKETPDMKPIEKLADALIANEKTPFTAESKDTLLLLNENQLKALANDETPAEDTPDADPNADPAKEATPDADPAGDTPDAPDGEDKVVLSNEESKFLKDLMANQEKSLESLRNSVSKSLGLAKEVTAEMTEPVLKALQNKATSDNFSYAGATGGLPTREVMNEDGSEYTPPSLLLNQGLLKKEDTTNGKQ